MSPQQPGCPMAGHTDGGCRGRALTKAAAAFFPLCQGYLHLQAPSFLPLLTPAPSRIPGGSRDNPLGWVGGSCNIYCRNKYVFLSLTFQLPIPFVRIHPAKKTAPTGNKWQVKELVLTDTESPANGKSEHREEMGICQD